MNCPKCNAEIAESELTRPSGGDAARAVLTDLRIWLAAVVIMLIAGVITSALGVPSAVGVGGGAAIGVLVATRIARLRSCPKCSAVIDAPPAQAA